MTSKNNLNLVKNSNESILKMWLKYTLLNICDNIYITIYNKEHFYANIIYIFLWGCNEHKK